MNKIVKIVLGGSILGLACFMSYELGKLKVINEDIKKLEEIQTKLENLSSRTKESKGVANDGKSSNKA